MDLRSDKIEEDEDVNGLNPCPRNPDFIPKKTIVLHAGTHAREWICPTTVINFAKMIVEDAREGGANAKYTTDITWYITINTNPDGYVKSHNENRMWRKTTNTNTPGPCTGVDPNRNFDANWSGPGASSNPCSDTYYGTSAFSEIETQAMADFLQGLNPKTGFQKSGLIG